MGVKQYKPTSPGRRFQSVPSFDEITTTKPERKLLRPLKRSGGRNSNGRITARHRGGGHKRKYRIIDFKRNKIGVPAKVATIEYDPNRSAHIALLIYKDGEKRYIISPNGLKVGDTIEAGKNLEIHPGNSMQLVEMPLGTTVHNIELKPGKGGQIARGAGSGAQVMAKEFPHVLLRLPSSITLLQQA